MKRILCAALLLAPLLPLAAEAQCILKLATGRPGWTDWQVLDTVKHEMKGMGGYKWTAPPHLTPFDPPGPAPMSPADVRGFNRAIAAETGLTEAQVAALPHRAAQVVVTPERPLTGARLPPDVRRWAIENGLDTTKLMIGESHEIK